MSNPIRSTSRRDFLKVTGSLSLAAGIAASLAACGGGTTKKKKAGGATADTSKANKDGAIIAGISYELGTNGYDPATTSSALTIAANWHTLEGLTELDPADRTVYNALAKETPKKVDDTTWEVTLRDGAKFSDGAAVTVEDVIFSYTRVLDPELKSLYRSMVGFIDKVEKKDDKTITFKLKQAFSLVPERLSIVKIVPKAAVEKDAKTFDLNPIGSGPYKMTDNGSASQKVVFERNENYNGPRPALAKTMTWQILPDPATRTNALTSATVQAIDSVPAADLANLKAPNKVSTVQGFGLLFAMFNQNGKFKDVKARQAIMYAMDYNKICDNGMAKLATPATCFVHKAHADYKQAKVVYKYDAAKAKSLLSEAGVTEIKVLASNHDWFSSVRAILKENFEALGVKISYDEKKSADVYSTIDGDPNAYDVLIAPGDPSVFGNDADLLMRWWYSTDVWTDKRMHWKGADSYTKVQEKLDAALKLTGNDQKKAWGEIFDLLSEQVPLYPIFHRKTPTAYNGETLVNFRPIAITGLSFENVGSTK